MSHAGPASISVRLLLFATYADLMGQHEVSIALPAGSTAADLVSWARRTLPGGDRLPERPLVAVNRRHVRLDTRINAGDEVALLPPMAGG